MGIVYCGPYADVIGGEHEGYAARVMPDGTRTGTWGGEHGWTGHVGFVAACGCGWTGDVVYPTGGFDSPGSQTAEEAWDRDHLRPLIAEAAGGWQTWAQAVGRRAVRAADLVDAGRPADAARVLTALREDLTARQYIVDELVRTDADAGGW